MNRPKVPNVKIRVSCVWSNAERREYGRWGTRGCGRLLRLGSLVGEPIHFFFLGLPAYLRSWGLSMPVLPSSSRFKVWPLWPHWFINTSTIFIVYYSFIPHKP